MTNTQDTIARLLTVDDAVSAIADYCAAMTKAGKEAAFSDLPRVLGLRAARSDNPALSVPNHSSVDREVLARLLEALGDADNLESVGVMVKSADLHAILALPPTVPAGVWEDGSELEALRAEVDRYRRPNLRNLSTDDPIDPLPTFQPTYLLGLALLFRDWCNSDLWGRPADAENAARICETAYLRLASPSPDTPEIEQREAGQ